MGTLTGEDVDWWSYVQGTRSRHVARYQAFAEAHKQTAPVDYDVLETELANIFAAIERARISEDWSTVVSTVYALLEGCLRVRGYWDESIRYGRVLAEAAQKAGDKRAEGWAWTSAIGWILIQQDNYEQGREAVERGLQAFKEAGSEWGCWQARRYLGHAYHAGGDLKRARATYLSALRDAETAYSTRFPTLSLLRRYVRFVRRNKRRGKWTWRAFIATRRADYRSITAHYYNDLGNVALEEGCLDEAGAYFEQALAHFRQLGREMEIGIVLNGLAHVAREQGAWEEARRLYTQSLEINQRYKRKVSLAEAHLGLSKVELAQGGIGNAQRLKEIGEDLYQSLGIDR